MSGTTIRRRSARLKAMDKESDDDMRPPKKKKMDDGIVDEPANDENEEEARAAVKQGSSSARRHSQGGRSELVTVESDDEQPNSPPQAAQSATEQDDDISIVIEDDASDRLAAQSISAPQDDDVVVVEAPSDSSAAQPSQASSSTRRRSSRYSEDDRRIVAFSIDCPPTQRKLYPEVIQLSEEDEESPSSSQPRRRDPLPSLPGARPPTSSARRTFDLPPSVAPQHLAALINPLTERVPSSPAQGDLSSDDEGVVSRRANRRRFISNLYRQPSTVRSEQHSGASNARSASSVRRSSRHTSQPDRYDPARPRNLTAPRGRGARRSRGGSQPNLISADFRGRGTRRSRPWSFGRGGIGGGTASSQRAGSPHPLNLARPTHAEVPRGRGAIRSRAYGRASARRAAPLPPSTSSDDDHDLYADTRRSSSSGFTSHTSSDNDDGDSCSCPEDNDPVPLEFPLSTSEETASSENRLPKESSGAVEEQQPMHMCLCESLCENASYAVDGAGSGGRAKKRKKHKKYCPRAHTDEECMICMSEMRRHAVSCKDKNGECLHRYHASCLRDWIKTGGRSCPKCRAHIKQIRRLKSGRKNRRPKQLSPTRDEARQDRSEQIAFERQVIEDRRALGGRTSEPPEDADEYEPMEYYELFSGGSRSELHTSDDEEYQQTIAMSLNDHQEETARRQVDSSDDSERNRWLDMVIATSRAEADNARRRRQQRSANAGRPQMDSDDEPGPSTRQRTVRGSSTRRRSEDEPRPVGVVPGTGGSSDDENPRTASIMSRNYELLRSRRQQQLDQRARRGRQQKQTEQRLRGPTERLPQRAEPGFSQGSAAAAAPPDPNGGAGTVASGICDNYEQHMEQRRALEEWEAQQASSPEWNEDEANENETAASNQPAAGSPDEEVVPPIEAWEGGADDCLAHSSIRLESLRQGGRTPEYFSVDDDPDELRELLRRRRARRAAIAPPAQPTTTNSSEAAEAPTVAVEAGEAESVPVATGDATGGWTCPCDYCENLEEHMEQGQELEVQRSHKGSEKEKEDGDTVAPTGDDKMEDEEDDKKAEEEDEEDEDEQGRLERERGPDNFEDDRYYHEVFEEEVVDDLSEHTLRDPSSGSPTVPSNSTTGAASSSDTVAVDDGSQTGGTKALRIVKLEETLSGELPDGFDEHSLVEMLKREEKMDAKEKIEVINLDEEETEDEDDCVVIVEPSKGGEEKPAESIIEDDVNIPEEQKKSEDEKEEERMEEEDPTKNGQAKMDEYNEEGVKDADPPIDSGEIPDETPGMNTGEEGGEEVKESEGVALEEDEQSGKEKDEDENVEDKEEEIESDGESEEKVEEKEEEQTGEENGRGEDSDGANQEDLIPALMRAAAQLIESSNEHYEDEGDEEDPENVTEQEMMKRLSSIAKKEKVRRKAFKRAVGVSIDDSDSDREVREEIDEDGDLDPESTELVEAANPEGDDPNSSASSESESDDTGNEDAEAREARKKREKEIRKHQRSSPRVPLNTRLRFDSDSDEDEEEDGGDEERNASELAIESSFIQEDEVDSSRRRIAKKRRAHHDDSNNRAKRGCGRVSVGDHPGTSGLVGGTETTSTASQELTSSRTSDNSASTKSLNDALREKFVEWFDKRIVHSSDEKKLKLMAYIDQELGNEQTLTRIDTVHRSGATPSSPPSSLPSLTSTPSNIPTSTDVIETPSERMLQEIPVTNLMKDEEGEQ